MRRGVGWGKEGSKGGQVLTLSDISFPCFYMISCEFIIFEHPLDFKLGFETLATSRVS